MYLKKISPALQGRLVLSRWHACHGAEGTILPPTPQKKKKKKLWEAMEQTAERACIYKEALTGFKPSYLYAVLP